MVVVIGMWGVSAEIEAGMKLQQPETLPGKLALDHRTLAVVCCTGFWKGVGSDLHLHTGPLVAPVVVVAVCACLCDPR